jgi:hypothetical protein
MLKYLLILAGILLIIYYYYQTKPQPEIWYEAPEEL